MSRAFAVFGAVVLAHLVLIPKAVAQSVSGSWAWAAADSRTSIAVQLNQVGRSASGTLTINETTVPVRGYVVATLLMATLGDDGKAGKFRANMNADGSLFSEIIAPNPQGGSDVKMRFTLVRASSGTTTTTDGAGAGAGTDGSTLADRALQKMRGSELQYRKEEYYGFDTSIFHFCANGRYLHGNESGSWQVVDRGGRAFLVMNAGGQLEEREITMDSDNIVYLDGKQFNRAGPAGC